jgi:hypothetical protein
MDQQAELPTEQENQENRENTEKAEKEIVLQVSQKTNKKKRNISEETREVMRERAKKALETRKKNLEIRKELGLHPHDPLPSKYQKKKPVPKKNDAPLPDAERVLTKGEDADKLRADSLEAKERRRPCNIEQENKLLKKKNKEYMLRDIVRSEFENCYERRRVEKEWMRESVARKAQKAEKAEKAENQEKPENQEKREKPKTLFKFADGTMIEI